MSKPSVFDAHAESYNHTHNEYLPLGVNHDQFREQKLEWVLSFQPKTLLDFGCNAGELPLDLLAKAPHITTFGIDESRDSIRIARERSTLVTQGLNQHDTVPSFFYEIKELPSEQKFDLITVFNVLHHVEPKDRKAILTQLATLLSPTGKLLIWEHNRWNPITRYLVKTCPFDEGVTLVKRSWLEKNLAEAGLQVNSLDYINVIPPSLQKRKWLSWVEPTFKAIPIGAQYRVIASTQPTLAAL